MIRRALSAFRAWRQARREARGPRPPNNPFVITVGPMVLIFVAVALLASVINLWPSVEATTTSSASVASTPSTHTVRLFFALTTVDVTPGQALLLLVILVGAAGSLIQAATSFGDYVGNREFFSSWVPWYVLRLVVGVLLALLLYFAVRGGFLNGNSQSGNVNPYGIAALAGLSGLFSKQATDKLKEVFETLFRVSKTSGDAQRRDSLGDTSPVVTAIEPSEVPAGRTGLTLTIHGERFTEASGVRLNGSAHQPNFVSATQLEVSVPDAALAAPGRLMVTVYNPPPDGAESDPARPLTIT